MHNESERERTETEVRMSDKNIKVVLITIAHVWKLFRDMEDIKKGKSNF